MTEGEERRDGEKGGKKEGRKKERREVKKGGAVEKREGNKLKTNRRPPLTNNSLQ